MQLAREGWLNHQRPGLRLIWPEEVETRDDLPRAPTAGSEAAQMNSAGPIARHWRAATIRAAPQAQGTETPIRAP